MTERFVANFQGKMLVSIRDKKRNCNVNILQIVEIANKLSNENEQLKKEIQNLTNDIHDACERIEEKDNLIKDLEKW